MPEQLAKLRDSLAGRYEIEREIGRGGMATVYRARDVQHERPVALKVLHPELAASVGAERFQQEIRLAARLQHPHILGVYDSGSFEGYLWFTARASRSPHSFAISRSGRSSASFWRARWRSAGIERRQSRRPSVGWRRERLRPTRHSRRMCIFQVVRVLIQSGEYDRALDLLEPLLTMNASPVTAAYAKIDPTFKPLMGNAGSAYAAQVIGAPEHYRPR